MSDHCIYLILVRGQVAEDEINAGSPVQISVERVEPAATLIAASSDQSGLVGLLRHLHSRGFVLQSVNCEQ